MAPPHAGAGGPPGGAAARIAGGSAVVLAGGLVDRGLRFLLNWFLSGALGPAGFGLYAWAVTWATTLASFAPVGLDTGIVLFVARYRRSGERGREKGALAFGLGLSLAVGLAAAAGLFVLAGPLTDSPDRGAALRAAAPVVALWTPLLYLVGTIRAVKDMRRSALAFQLLLPVLLLLGSGLAVLLGTGVTGALVALAVATLGGLAAAAVFALGHHGALLRDPATPPVWEPGALLRFSLPQGLTAAAFRLNTAMDLLMLGALASDADVGVYKIAASLAAFGSIPSNAVASMFNPFIAELVYVGETAQLDRLLKTVTRWLILFSAPVYLVLLVLPDVILGIYDPAYVVALWPLLLLVGGQAVQTACAPAMRLIPMSGHSMLNLVNGVAALVLNVALNAWLIPRMGATGAAWATGITLAAWSVWRVVEVRWLLGCFPFDLRSGLIVAGATLLGLGARLGGAGAGLGLRLGLSLGALVALGALALAVSRTPEDRALLQRLRQKLGRRRGGPPPGTAPPAGGAPAPAAAPGPSPRP